MNNILLTDVQILTSDTLLGSSIVPDNTPKTSILLNDVEIPVHDNLLQTKVTLNTSSPSNDNIFPTYENIEVIPSINPGSGSVFNGPLPKITSLDELLKYLSEIMIRFNSNPDYYMQDDFALLIKTLSNSLIFLYENNTTNVGTQSASFVGIANLNTNPFLEAAALNNKFPGIYFAQDIGYYPIFGLNVTNDDIYNNILLLIPKITNNIFIEYQKYIYHLNISSDKHLKYSSNTKKSVWDINHNMNKFPSVVITDTAGTSYEGKIVYIDNNNLTITFSAPFKGYADLN